MKVLVTCTHLIRDLEDFRDEFARYGMEPVAADVPGQELAGDALASQLSGCVGVVAGDDRFHRDVIAAAPQLRAIAKWGIGVDGIDFEAASDHGVKVSNTPGMFDDEVADVALAYLIMLSRDLHLIDRGVRDGGWPKPPGRSLRGATLGVVGLGGIGRAMATRALALGMTVIGTDPSSTSVEAAAAAGVEVVDFESLLPRSEFLSLHCPLTPATHHLLDDRAFAALPDGVRVINVARGPVIQETALVSALQTDKVAAAALDVFETEPLPADSPLRHFPQLVFGSHNASNTLEAAHRTHRAAIANLARDLGLAA